MHELYKGMYVTLTEVTSRGKERIAKYGTEWVITCFVTGGMMCRPIRGLFDCFFRYEQNKDVEINELRQADVLGKVKT